MMGRLKCHWLTLVKVVQLLHGHLVAVLNHHRPPQRHRAHRQVEVRRLKGRLVGDCSGGCRFDFVVRTTNSAVHRRLDRVADI